MDLNIQKMTNHPPSPVNTYSFRQIFVLFNYEQLVIELTADNCMNYYVLTVLSIIITIIIIILCINNIIYAERLKNKIVKNSVPQIYLCKIVHMMLYTTVEGN